MAFMLSAKTKALHLIENKKAIIFIILLLSITLLLTGCSASPNDEGENTTSRDRKEVVTLSDELWGSVELAPVASSNIIKLSEGLKPSDIQLKDIVPGAGIKGEILDTQGRRQIKILYDLTIIGDKVFEGPSATAIFSLADRAVYSSKQLSRIIANSNNIIIEANDIDNQEKVKDIVNLAKVVRESEKVKDDTEQMVTSFGEEYPCYTITIPSGSENIVIHLLNKKYFYVTDATAIRVYRSSNSLWNYCEKIIPLPQPAPESLAFLFTADSLESKELGYATHRKLAVARLLQKGVPQNNIQIKEPLYHLTFTINQETIYVVLGKDEFQYKGKTYKLENVAKDFQGLVSAG